MVAQPTDESKTSILPEPELNPLLNPLLAAHMGRWAEVYFTSPPERRAQAVSDLVRELANHSMPDPARNKNSQADINNDRHVWGKRDEVPLQNLNPVRQPTNSDNENFSELETPNSSIFDSVNPESANPESSILESGICESCGHQNTAQQRFCGMCGMPLILASETPSQPARMPEPLATTWDESNVSGSSAPEGQWNPAGASMLGLGHHAESYHTETYREEEYREEFDPRSELSVEQKPAEFSMLSDYQSESASPSYRLYIGAVVAILLGLLVYMTWRSNSAFWSSGTAPSALPESPKSEAAAEPAAEPAAQPRPDASTATEAARTDSRPPTQEPPAVRPQPTRPVARRIDRRIKAAPPIARTASPNPSASNAGLNGSEELSAAERYLNGGAGTARDSRQAATWLWKAVAKQNPTATLLLSDLYLRGDGVNKSCDQARLLLDAAARKGATAAAQRLRNLQAFGCR